MWVRERGRVADRGRGRQRKKTEIQVKIKRISRERAYRSVSYSGSVDGISTSAHIIHTVLLLTANIYLVVVALGLTMWERKEYVGCS